MCMIVYCHSLPVPNAVTLYPDDSTESSVSASWTKPDGKVQRYEISCETGYSFPNVIEETGQDKHVASCVELPNAGSSYAMTVYSIVENKNSSSTIHLQTGLNIMLFASLFYRKG